MNSSSVKPREGLRTIFLQVNQYFSLVCTLLLLPYLSNLSSAVNTLSSGWTVHSSTELGQHRSCLQHLCKLYGFGARKVHVFYNSVWLVHSQIWFKFYCSAHLLNIILVISINQPASTDSTHKYVKIFSIFYWPKPMSFCRLNQQTQHQDQYISIYDCTYKGLFCMCSGLIYSVQSILLLIHNHLVSFFHWYCF